MENSKIEILLIEDDLAEANLIREMLAESRRWEFSVQHARSLADGLALLKNRSFDSILVDLGLPDSQGLETALTVRDQAKLTPIAIVTILDDEELALKALQMDIQDYMVKGEITGTLLVRSIRYAIQRKHDIEALRESEQRFASFMFNMPAAAWIKDLHGRYVYANTETERIFAMPLSEFSGKSDEEFLPPETARQFRENDERVLVEGGCLRTTEILPQTNGIEHHHIVSKFPVPGPDGRPAYIGGVASDITDRVLAEEALHFSEERFRALVTASSEVLYRMSPDWSEMRQLYSQAFSETPSSTWLQKYIHPDDHLHVTDVIRAAIRTKSMLELEHRVRRVDGSQGWILSRAVPLLDANGEIIEWFGASSDITGRKEAEEALRKSERKFAKVFHTVPALIGISTLEEGRFVDVNETALQLLGYRRDEVIGRTAQEINLWEDPSVPARVMQALEEQGAIENLEVRFRGKSGQIFTGLYSAEVVDFNGDQYRLGLVKDITERKEAEEALVRAKEQWELTFNSVPDLIAVLDNRQRIVQVNKAMSDRLGQPAGECIGLPCYQVIHQSETLPAGCPHARTLEDEREHHLEVCEAALKGEFLVSTTPLMGTDGKMHGAVHVARDITEQKMAAKEIERLNTALAARAAELEAANKELEAFNYTVAHDLRKPLTVVNGYCQAIIELCGPTLDKECMTFVREAYEGTLRMNRLIDTLLLFSQAAHAEPKREWVDLSTAAQEVAKELKQAEPGRTVTFRITPGLAVEGDKNLLRVVVANLLGNSWKFTADREEAVIELGAVEVGGKAAFFVRDNGIGFDMAEAGEIFTPFRRLTSGQRIGGLGIGLATVQRIIAVHGGRIWAEGEPGKGATFFFTLGERQPDHTAGCEE